MCNVYAYHTLHDAVTGMFGRSIDASQVHSAPMHTSLLIPGHGFVSLIMASPCTALCCIDSTRVYVCSIDSVHRTGQLSNVCMCVCLFALLCTVCPVLVLIHGHCVRCSQCLHCTEVIIPLLRAANV